MQRLSDAGVDNTTIRTAISGSIANEKLIQILQSRDLDTGIHHAFSHSKTLQGFLKHMHDWFDAFKTLKSVHGLRDDVYPSISFRELQMLTPPMVGNRLIARSLRCATQNQISIK